MLEQIHNPSVLYPFLHTENLTQAQISTAKSVKDCRICLILRDYSLAAIFLVKATSKALTFKVKQEGQQDYRVTVDLAGRVTADTDNIVSQNTYVIPSNTSFVPMQQQGQYLQLLTQKTIQVDRGLNLSLISRQVHASAQPQSPVASELNNIDVLRLNTGYNTEVQLDNNEITVTAAQGLGKGNPTGYSYWKQYEGGYTPNINRQYAGVRWINGYTPNVLIDTSVSLMLGVTAKPVTMGPISGKALTISIKRKPAEDEE